MIPTYLAPAGFRRLASGLLVPDDRVRMFARRGRSAAAHGGALVGHPVIAPTMTVVEAPPSDPPAVYLNTQEATDANTLYADDFYHGFWYKSDCDADGYSAANKGWCATIFANPITPTDAFRDNSDFGSSYAGTHGVMTGSIGGRNMASHRFSEEVTEFYYRFYTKPLSGYLFGAEKILTLNRLNDDAGIWFGNLHFNIGLGTPQATGSLQYQCAGGSPFETINKSTGLSLGDAGNWYFIEIHCKLPATAGSPPSSDGVLEIWADDVGSTGQSPPGSPTLRFQQTDFLWHYPTTADKFGRVWHENWANPASTGERLLKNCFASKTGPIGLL